MSTTFVEDITKNWRSNKNLKNETFHIFSEERKELQLERILYLQEKSIAGCLFSLIVLPTLCIKQVNINAHQIYTELIEN